MHRLLRLSFLAVLLGIFIINEGNAQLPQIYVSGKIQPNEVRVFLKDTVYVIDQSLVVGGTLIIEPGTTILFNPNGRLIDSVGGRIIADGFASSFYKPSPNNLVPLPGHPNNFLNCTGYSDLTYFLYKSTVPGAADSTIKPSTKREKSVNSDKWNYIFNVRLDLSDRRIKNLQVPVTTTDPIITYEEAIVYSAARLQNPDPIMNNFPYNSDRVNFNEARIKFVGQKINSFSREWGHIIILPGARAAFFRNCDFENFRKDTTVDRVEVSPIYSATSFPATDFLPQTPTNNDIVNYVNELNYSLNDFTNGGGGAITTFSSRTWLIDCEFKNNFARNQGGAIQFLQTITNFNMSKTGFMPNYFVTPTETYSPTKNPVLTEKDGAPSSYNNSLLLIDKIDEPGLLEPITDQNRQAWDDGRISILLGRIRNLKFTNNKVLLSNIITINQGGTQIVTDDTLHPALNQEQGRNFAVGGAIYLEGRTPIEVGFGINDTINLNNGTGISFLPDRFDCIGNQAINYQDLNTTWTYGALGGAICTANATSLIVAGNFESNKTNTPYIKDNATSKPEDVKDYSRGGGIYSISFLSPVRLQVRGGTNRSARNNSTIFLTNESGVGGAICMDNVQATWNNNEALIIGGNDVKNTSAPSFLNPRDFGYDIKFSNNNATIFGGAIYTEKNLSINGAGGVAGTTLVGYGGLFPILFEKNTARYAGGALNINFAAITPTSRNAQIIRTIFSENKAGYDDLTATENKKSIRGGGAIYSIDGEVNIVKAVNFFKNKVRNGNGGAIAIVRPVPTTKRNFVTDLDAVSNGYITPSNDVFTSKSTTLAADQRMLTSFFGNEAFAEPEMMATENGTGTTQVEVPGTIIRNLKLNATVFTTDSTGFAVASDGTFMKITQSGKKWEYIDISIPLNDVAVLGNTVFVVGRNGCALKSNNQGTTWTSIGAGVIAPYTLNAIKINGIGIGFIVGDNGKIYQTTDG